jgi:hypothetical protein
MSFLQFALIAILVMMGLIYFRLGGILDALKGGGSASKAAAPTSASAFAPAARGKTIHPGLSDEQFIAIISAAAAHTFGQSVNVVKFKPLNTMDWTWAVQGRVALHKNKV